MALDISYHYFVAELYAYSGMELDYSGERLSLSYFITSLFIYYLLIFKNKIATFFVLVLFIFLFLPIQTLWVFGGGSSVFFAQVCFGLTLILIFSQIHEVRFFSVKQGNSLLVLILTSMLILYVALVGAKGAYKLISFDFSDMYENRELLFEQVFHGFFGYFASWVGKVVLPLLLAIALWRKSYILAIAIFAVSILNYGLVQRKEFLMFPIIVCYFYFVYHSKPNAIGKFSSVILLFLTIALSSYVVTENSIIAGVIFHRLFFVVAQNHFEYFNFFQSNPLVFLSNSIFSSFVDYPYNDKIPTLIGFGRFSEGQDSFANTGLFASAYMHFGGLGVVVYSVLTGTILSVYNSLVKQGAPTFMVYALGFISVFQLVNGDLTATLLTHGMGLGIILLMLIDKTKPLIRLNFG
jgi:hypothetical protein